MERSVYLYVTDTMADWEIGYITAEINTGRFFKKGAENYTIKTVGVKKQEIISMGGLRIEPDLILEQCDAEVVDALILPGAQTWLEPFHQDILKLAGECIAQNKIVAGICGATFGMAQAGYLNKCQHTSNNLDFLKLNCPAYAGENFYQKVPAVNDNNIITASGIAPLDFAFQILKSLDVMDLSVLETWYNLYSTKDEKYFFSLMELLS